MSYNPVFKLMFKYERYIIVHYPTYFDFFGILYAFRISRNFTFFKAVIHGIKNIIIDNTTCPNSFIYLQNNSFLSVLFPKKLFPPVDKSSQYYKLLSYALRHRLWRRNPYLPPLRQALRKRHPPLQGIVRTKDRAYQLLL